MTEDLRPQDLFAERRLRAPCRRRRNLAVVVNQQPENNNRRVSPRSEKKRSPVAKRSKNNNTVEGRKENVTSGGLVNGQVTLLKRGEPLDLIALKIKGSNPNPSPIDVLERSDADRIGPESPEMLPKQIRLSPGPHSFAGSVISLSPSPRALPLPSFFNTKQQQSSDPMYDLATMNLRRMLRLE